MQTFASGCKRNYYGKADVSVYRLHRGGQLPEGRSPVFAANVALLLYGDAFWTTYEKGDNTNLIATDSMKNFIQRETMQFEGFELEEYCRFVGDKFLAKYPQTEGLQISAHEIPYETIRPGSPGFAPAGPERAFARLELDRSGVREAVSGLQGFRLLRLGGSAFRDFVRDEYTTLPDIHNRPLHMWLDLEWSVGAPGPSVVQQVRTLVLDTFHGFESGSIQQVIYEIGTKILASIPLASEVHLEANNRTWDTIVEQGGQLGVYTDARPPYGILGLRLRR